jgi:outer membrane protein assembly factor BamE (lipoprotein component of BamABCDE complex)
MAILMSCNNKHEYQEDLFKQVKTGMTKDEVIEILGLPDTTYYSIVDSSEYIYVYFSKDYQLKSDPPTISFDSGKVVWAGF